MKVKHMWIIFAIFFPCLLGAKIYQSMLYVYTSQESTGFDLITTSVLLGLVLFLFILLLFTKWCKNTPSQYIFKRNIFAGIFSTLLGLSLIYEYFNNFFGAALLSRSLLIISIASLIAGIVFIIISIFYFIGKPLTKKTSWLTLIPVIWVCIRLIIITFLDYTKTIIMSTNIDLVLSLLFLFIYLFAYSKLIIYNQSKNTFKRIVPIALLTITTLSIYNVTSIYINFTLSSNNIYSFLLPYITDLMALLFVLSVTIQMTSQLSKLTTDTNEEKTNEDIDDEKNIYSNYTSTKQTQTQQKQTKPTQAKSTFFDTLVVDVNNKDEEFEESKKKYIDTYATIQFERPIYKDEEPLKDKNITQNEKANETNDNKNIYKQNSNSNSNIDMDKIDELIKEILEEDK